MKSISAETLDSPSHLRKHCARCTQAFGLRASLVKMGVLETYLKTYLVMILAG
jgi:hypothetical protein